MLKERKRQLSSIKNRLVYWFLTLIIILLLGAGLLIYNQKVQSIRHDIKMKLSAIRDLKIYNIYSWLNDKESDLKIIVSNEDIKEAKKSLFDETLSEKDRAEKKDHIRSILRNYTNYYIDYNDFFIVDNNTGKIIISTDVESEGLDVSDQDFFIVPLETRDSYLHDVGLSLIYNVPAIFLARPIYELDRPGNITGLLVASISVHNSLYTLLQDRSGMGETGETIVINRDNYVINELLWYANEPLQFKIDAEPANRAVGGQTGYIETKDYRNINVVAAYGHLPGLRWGLVAKQDRQEVYAQAHTLLIQLIIIFFITIIMITLVVLFIARSITMPLTEITMVSEKLKNGDLSIRTSHSFVERSDEFGVLARSINSMADSIASQFNLEKNRNRLVEDVIKTEDLDEFASMTVKLVMEITDSHLGAFYLLNEQSRFEPLFSCGFDSSRMMTFSKSELEGEIGNVVLNKRLVCISNLKQDTVFTYNTVSGGLLPSAIVSIPIIYNGVVEGVLSLGSLEGYNKEQIDYLDKIRISLNTLFSNIMATRAIRKLAGKLDNQSRELKQKSQELKRQNIELVLQREQVEEASKLKSEFLSSMSHELRTPLNSILALSKLLMSRTTGKLDEKESGYLEIVQRNGRKLLALINDILDLSKIEAGVIELSYNPFSLKALIDENLACVEVLAREKGVHLYFICEDELPVIYSDEKRVYKIFQNIIGNAVKFTDSGKVEVRAESEHGFVRVKVIDTGVGIPEEQLDHIFEEFRQVDGSTSRLYEGTGLGLAIAAKSAKLLGGDIEVESVLGSGSIFTITLPLKKNGIPLELLKEKKEVEGEVIDEEKKTILVVDDDRSVVNVLSSYFKEWGYQVIRAVNGEEALRLASTHLPFLITLDIIMPGMDGWEVLQRLKEDSATASIPVIIVSISHEQEVGMALGASAYIIKPVDKSTLLEEIKRVVYTPNLVVVVDDSSEEREYLKGIIEEEQCEVIEAKNGLECLQVLKSITPDLIISDLLMPGMNGFELLDKLRVENATNNIPVIILTGKDLTSSDKRRLESSVSSILSKSDFDEDRFIHEVKAIIEHIEHSEVRREVYQVGPKMVEPALDFAEGRNGERASVMLIEDNYDNILTMRAILEDNYNVVEALNGEEGLEKLRDFVPHLILLDISLPGLSGYKVLEELKLDSRLKNVPVVALTAHAMKGDRERILANGFDAYLAKPVDIELLNSLLSKLLNKSIGEVSDD